MHIFYPEAATFMISKRNNYCPQHCQSHIWGSQSCSGSKARSAEIPPEKGIFRDYLGQPPVSLTKQSSQGTSKTGNFFSKTTQGLQRLWVTSTFSGLATHNQKKQEGERETLKVERKASRLPIYPPSIGLVLHTITRGLFSHGLMNSYKWLSLYTLC